MKIGYQVVMVCSALMKNGKFISFEIPVEVPFATQQEAECHESNFSARMERKDVEVVINLYQRNQQEQDLVGTIRWENRNLYKCTITRESSVGKTFIDPVEDEEPCAMDNGILPLLTEKDSFSLQYLAYGVEPLSYNGKEEE
ncbi:hypothetical protein RZO55_14410 [Clostridium boliviensis]|uniref:Uncharacterized protein n=1 Tax=Clostridium boliviensis TaxID=318465 RepID=A0ABU4GMB6_9CLOT|nr:hypothetical protein [Clostridium boliviensis]MDW2798768.1 hypothetical protein [Clostridium boliviensis]